MALNKTHCSKDDDALKLKLQELAKATIDAVPACSRALLGMVAALDYKDKAVVQSYVHEVLDALKGCTQEHIEVLRTLSLTEIWEKQKKEMTTVVFAGHELDEAGQWLEKLRNDKMELINGLRRAVESLKKHDYEVENAAYLDEELEALRKFKTSVLDNWPWSTRPLPPVNRQMVAESRAASKRGEGEPIDKLISRLGGEAAK